MYKVDNFNRDYVIERYADDIVGRLHFLDIKLKLRDCIIKEKQSLSNEEIEYEIMRHDPSLMGDIYIEELMEEVSHA